MNERREFPVSLSTFKWAIGLLGALTIALFSIPLYKIFDADEALHGIHIEQIKIAERMKSVDSKIDAFIIAQDNRVGNIERELSDRHDSMEAMRKRIDNIPYIPAP